MKHIIIAALFAASIFAGEPDWGKIVEDSQSQSRGGRHDDDHGHPSPVPEPAGFILVGIGLVGAAIANRRRK